MRATDNIALRPTRRARTRFESFRPPDARDRIWFGLYVTGVADAPGAAESGSVPNLIRATGDSRPAV
jgi:hypothetical protein